MLSMVKIRQIARTFLVMNLWGDRADRRIQKPVKHLRSSATCFGKILHLRCFTGFWLHLYRLTQDMNGMQPVSSFSTVSFLYRCLTRKLKEIYQSFFQCLMFILLLLSSLHLYISILCVQMIWGKLIIKSFSTACIWFLERNYCTCFCFQLSSENPVYSQKQPPEVFCKKTILKNSAKFTQGNTFRPAVLL